MFSEFKNNFNGFSVIDVHQNATLSESFEGDRSRVIGNRCKLLLMSFPHCAISRHVIFAGLELLHSIHMAHEQTQSNGQRLRLPWCCNQACTDNAIQCVRGEGESFKIRNTV